VDQRKTVLLLGVTGGVGEAVGDRLAGLGYQTIVTCRTEQQKCALEASGRFAKVLILDFAKLASIDKAFHQLREEGVNCLDGIINCAAVLHAEPLETITIEAFHGIQQVNVYGTLHAVQRAIPLLRPRRGRVVLVGSLSSTWAMPLTGAYVASKFALEGLCDCLRRELFPFGIKVVLVKPGGIKTRMSMDHVTAVKREVETLKGNAQLYGSFYLAHADAVPKSYRYATPTTGIADVVVKAFTAARPKARYLAGKDCKIMCFLDWLLPDSTMDWLSRLAFPLAKFPNPYDNNQRSSS
jgi:NAD(P)-dependent dehydrogenase (short-subunit alcohol dehydrogenase family)